MRQGLGLCRTMGAEIWTPSYLALLAEACEKAEQEEEGLSLVDEALEVAHNSGQPLSEARLYMLKGTLTLQKEFQVQGSTFQVENPQSAFHNPQLETEACFLKSIEIARQQQAKSLELRAATSLARLWQQQGKKTEAHKLLSDVYNWFTEGFDTKDLQEAKALLEELA